ncbi:MAG: peptidylprolyl isomerase [Polyangiales bacterium]
MRKLLKEPLFHFLLGGVALFVLYGVVGDREQDVRTSNVVEVDRETLLTFIQYRTKAFEPSVAAKRLDALSDEELDRLIEQYVREEILYREAIALGLDQDDYIIRRRLVQKLEFITEGFAEETVTLDKATLGAYFKANKADYHVEPSVTFTHVFFETENRAPGAAKAMAEAKLAELNRDQVPFSKAPAHGDRFLYHLNYVERTPAYVASHFGGDMAEEIFTLSADTTRWLGPLRSPYGFHLVLIAASEAGRDPALEEVKDRVYEDARVDHTRRRTEEAVERVIEAYEVRVAPVDAIRPVAAQEENISP